MKIYTKTGDTGLTSLFGGTRVPKHHIRIESYGTIDELNSHIGLLRDQEIENHYKEVLLEIQDRLLNESITNLYRSNGQIEDSLHRRFDDESRDVRERINQIHYEISHRDESLSRRIDELNSYVDRRFDKLLSDPKFCLNKEDKKLIKG